VTTPFIAPVYDAHEQQTAIRGIATGHSGSAATAIHWTIARGRHIQTHNALGTSPWGPNRRWMCPIAAIRSSASSAPT